MIQIDDRIKFGKTKNIVSRLSTYKSSSGIEPKVLDLVFKLGYSKIEKELKEEYSGLGITKEWFEINHLDLLEKKFKNL